MSTLGTGSSALRQNILHRALTLVSQQSFTRNTLIAALASLPAQTSDIAALPLEKSESVIDTLFGTGKEAEKALVREWELKGLSSIKDAFQQQTDPSLSKTLSSRIARIHQGLSSRLAYSSSTASEHLVQAHAVLATPSYAAGTSSIKIPSVVHSLTRGLAGSLRLPPTYTPPDRSSAVDVGSDSRNRGGVKDGPGFGKDFVTIPVVNPLPIFQYGFRIADEVLVSGKGEDEGGGTDWYARRIALSLIYLHAESHLLHPRPAQTTPVTTFHPDTPINDTDPLLPAALAQLSTSLDRYAYLAERNLELRSAERQVGEFAGFVWKSWGGLFRSRGWIH